MRSGSLVALLAAAILSACTSSSPATGSACSSAGGNCVLGGASCSKQAGSSAQDCNPPPENPGGAFCCLDLAQADAGHDTDLASTTLPACSWPASLDAPDADTTQCVAARTYLSCTFASGIGEDCMSSSATRCPGTGPAVGGAAGPATCTNLCNADEYAVGCGGPGPARPPPLPSGCRNLPAGPGGGISGCCPCGS
jgi:hypothetical protein